MFKVKLTRNDQVAPIKLKSKLFLGLKISVILVNLVNRRLDAKAIRWKRATVMPTNAAASIAVNISRSLGWFSYYRDHNAVRIFIFKVLSIFANNNENCKSETSSFEHRTGVYKIMDIRIEGRHAYKHMNSESKLFSAYSKVRFIPFFHFIKKISIGSLETTSKKRVVKPMAWDPKIVRLIQTNGSNGTQMPLEKVFGSRSKIFH